MPWKNREGSLHVVTSLLAWTSKTEEMNGEGREGEKQAAEWQVRLLHAPSTGLVRMRMTCLPRAWRHDTSC